jgi:hypothetical protein
LGVCLLPLLIGEGPGLPKRAESRNQSFHLLQRSLNLSDSCVGCPATLTHQKVSGLDTLPYLGPYLADLIVTLGPKDGFSLPGDRSREGAPDLEVTTDDGLGHHWDPLLCAKLFHGGGDLGITGDEKEPGRCPDHKDKGKDAHDPRGLSGA